MIEINRVNKVFYQGEKEINALRDINLTIEQGTIFGVIGSSGAGKSTPDPLRQSAGKTNQWPRYC